MKVGFIVMATSFLPLHAKEIEGDQAEHIDVSSLPVEERLVLAEEIRAFLQARIDRDERIEGQASFIQVKVSIADMENRVVVDLGRGYIPTYDGYELEQLIHGLSTKVDDYLRGKRMSYRTDIYFGDMSLDDYHRIEDEKIQRPMSNRFRRESPSDKLKVVVAAGHGMYYHRGFKKWIYQRDQHNGIIEDLMTPRISRRLVAYLERRSGVEVATARSEATERFEDSGLSYFQLAARYRLKSLLPNIPTIWNNFGTKDSSRVELQDDILSRPLYANYVGADALIHVHTNASETSSARGIRVYYQKGRADSIELARNAACYMKESIQSLNGYSDFLVEREPYVGNHGENRLATMPSIIAEVGFHTNAEDAEAIKSPVFQDAAMRGLEKGYRMFREGKGCETFTVGFPDVDLVSGESRDIDVVVGGNPRYPIRYSTHVIECTPGILCTGGSGVFYDAKEAHLTARSCRTASKPFKIVWEVTARDEDGIVATTQSAMTCQPKA